MTDPYKVLGVDYNAGEKEIKLAYKELVKQYHPDRFQVEEEVKLATQKMTDINSAYDQIMDDRRRGISPQSYARRSANEQRTQNRSQGGTYGANGRTASGANFRRYTQSDYNFYNNMNRGMGMGMGANYGIDYTQIRNIIASGDLGTADSMLENIPENMRSAEWHYVKGMVFMRRGWLNDAYHSVRTATQMDPGNQEYQNTFSEMNRSRSGYMTGSNSSSGGKAGDCCGTCCDGICSAEGCECCCTCLGDAI